MLASRVLNASAFDRPRVAPTGLRHRPPQGWCAPSVAARHPLNRAYQLKSNRATSRGGDDQPAQRHLEAGGSTPVPPPKSAATIADLKTQLAHKSATIKALKAEIAEFAKAAEEAVTGAEGNGVEGGSSQIRVPLEQVKRLLKTKQSSGEAGAAVWKNEYEKLMAQHTKRVQALEADAASAQKQVECIGAQLEEALAGKAAAETSLRAMEQQVDAMNATVDALKQSGGAAEAQISQLTNELQVKASDVATLRQNAEQAEASLRHAENRTAALQRQIDEVNAQEAQLRQQLHAAEYRAQSLDQQQQLLDVNKLRVILDKELDVLRNNLAEARVRKQSGMQANSGEQQLRSERDAAVEAGDAAVKARDAAVAARERAVTEVQQKDELVRGLQEQLEKAVQEAGKLSAELLEECELRRTEVRRLNELLGDAEARCEKLAGKLAATQREWEATASQLVSKTHDVVQLEEQLDEAEARLERLAKEVEEAREARDAALSAGQLKTDEVTRLEEKLAGLETRSTELAGEVTAARNEKDAALTAQSQGAAGMLRLEERLAGLEARSTQLANELASVRKERDTASSAQSQTAADVVRLEKSLSESEARSDKLADELAAVRQERDGAVAAGQRSAKELAAVRQEQGVAATAAQLRAEQRRFEERLRESEALASRLVDDYTKRWNKASVETDAVAAAEQRRAADVRRFEQQLAESEAQKAKLTEEVAQVRSKAMAVEQRSTEDVHRLEQQLAEAEVQKAKLAEVVVQARSKATAAEQRSADDVRRLEQQLLEAEAQVAEKVVQARSMAAAAEQRSAEGVRRLEQQLAESEAQKVKLAEEVRTTCTERDAAVSRSADDAQLVDRLEEQLTEADAQSNKLAGELAAAQAQRNAELAAAQAQRDAELAAARAQRDAELAAVRAQRDAAASAARFLAQPEKHPLKPTFDALSRLVLDQPARSAPNPTSVAASSQATPPRQVSGAPSAPPTMGSVQQATIQEAGPELWLLVQAELLRVREAMYNGQLPDIVSADLDGETGLSVLLRGPPGSLYDGGLYSVRLAFPDLFPVESPVVLFNDRIFHINVDDCNIMQLPRTPSLTLPAGRTIGGTVYNAVGLLAAVAHRLASPDLDFVANPLAAQLYILDRADYERRVKFLVMDVMYQ